MKRGEREIVKRLEEILLSAHRTESEIAPDDRWQVALMRDIRNLGPLGGEARILERFNSLVWRFSLAGGICVAALVLYTLKTGLFPFQDVAVALLDDPVGVLYSGLM